MRIKVPTDLFPCGRWLLCPPTFFDVNYEINPWMSLDITPHHTRAAKQWKLLHHTLIRLGAFIDYIEPTKEQPDLVFTANAGLVLNDKVVLSKFRHPERQGEEAVNKAWFEERGFDVVELTGDYCFEGEGDALFAGDLLFCGHSFRSDPEAYEEVTDLLGVSDYLLCELTDSRFYHLDTCFCPLSEHLAMAYKGAFTEEGFKEMEKQIEIIQVSKEDAEKFVCNAVVLGHDIVLPAGCDSTYETLKARGFRCFDVELDEFLKGGGSAKCLTVRLDRKGASAA